ncbi:hypothetical protein LPTSP3_g01730 [Leptospira kobayashii]|uniref:Uncharacterized protein n=1 Tax=Leptospira kobayashii TaxID=1917830 RepID=A0ABM7UFC2_9LEPT|nr:hypothetical protein [Leptospira kobayashii]BDA77243.1 hypothetical protein LPTSP3_g01730 [Leptospira kobayashii]
MYKKYMKKWIIFVHVFFLTNGFIFAQSLSMGNDDKVSYEKVTKESLMKRRSFLEWHQIAGLTTLAFWLATNLEGEKASRSLYRKSDEFAQGILLTHPEYANNDPLYAIAFQSLDKHSIAANYLLLKDPQNNASLYFALKANEEWEAKNSGSAHKELAMATFGMYALTAGLAYFAPPKIEEEYTGEVRFYSPIFAHKAMIPIHLASMLLLPGLGARIGKEGPNAVRDMQQVGWAGFGAMSISVLVITF